jgi:hypothetical protein
MHRCSWFLAILLTALGCQPVSLETPPTPKPQRKVLLEVIQHTSSITKSERLVYLRVFFDGTAECHPERNVDYSNLTLVGKRIAAHELESLEELLNSTEVEQLDSEYRLVAGAKDYFKVWNITIPRKEGSQQIEVVNFVPRLAVRMKKPYPEGLVRLGCFITDLRSTVSGEATLFEDPYCKRSVEGN